MPTRESAPHGAPSWIDLDTSDVERSKTFYEALFGWTFDGGGEEFGGYVNCRRNGRAVAGLMQKEAGDARPDAWTTYLAVVDTTATTSRVAGAGGQVLVEPTAVGDQGTFAIFVDPTCALVGAWQAAAHVGYEIHGEHGAPWWHELVTTDHDKAVRFYEDVFGWRTEPFVESDEMRYTLMKVDGAEHAGVEDAALSAPGTPSAWRVFFAVDDVDETVAAATENGGKVLRAAEDSEFGRMAWLADPTGAEFGVRGEVAAGA